MSGPDISWYLAVAGVLFATGALGVLLRRSPLIVLLVSAIGGVILGTELRRDPDAATETGARP